jgi:hypothetical protein
VDAIFSSFAHHYKINFRCKFFFHGYSLIKVALMLKNGSIPPQINFTQLNPLLHSEFKPFKILTKQYDLNPDEINKYFGVSSLGIGGTNAHVLLTGHEKITISNAPKQKATPKNSYLKKKFWLNRKDDCKPAYTGDKSIVTELICVWREITGEDHIDVHDGDPVYRDFPDEVKKIIYGFL